MSHYRVLNSFSYRHPHLKNDFVLIKEIFVRGFYILSNTRHQFQSLNKCPSSAQELLGRMMPSKPLYRTSVDLHCGLA
ncbi:hypothetical protein BDR03DRAFT_751886 [Suillus americanus]|nr:hypothetical protein BDR03DRAFT_751886 [Suillus americanus]